MASPGLELLWALASPEISQPQDALVCFIHWDLISHGLRCLGTGEKAGAQEMGSERLPPGWANNKELYTLRYVLGEAKYLVKALIVDRTLLVNVMETQKEKVSDLTLDIAEFIDSAHVKDFNRVYKSPAVLKKKLQTKLISPLLGSKEKAKEKESTWKSSEKEHVKPAAHDPLRDPTRLPFLHTREEPSRSFPYGEADLNPLGGGSGGMIFNPFGGHPSPDPLPGLPPGAVPPGARFDPIRPPGSGRSDPDPDHMPPPGYTDMFM